jgi:succinate dehydrogenase/fumarate reductase cytochrome b subunit
MSKAVVFTIKAIGLVLAVALSGLWAYWVWQWDWGVFLQNRRWILCFVALIVGTPLLFMGIGGSAFALADWAEERFR